MQYDESDLQFVQRLCCEEGIHFHFQHSATAHLLVFGDDQTVFPRLAPVAYQQDSGLVADRRRSSASAYAWKPAPAASPAATTTSRNRA